MQIGGQGLSQIGERGKRGHLLRPHRLAIEQDGNLFPCVVRALPRRVAAVVRRHEQDVFRPQEREQFSRAFFDILSRGGRTKTLEDLRSGGLAAGAALLREYAGADEEKKKIISEIFRRLAVDVKDELMKAAGAGVRRAGETILATGQAIADLRK